MRHALLARTLALLLAATVGCRSAHAPLVTAPPGRDSQQALNRAMIEAAYRGDEPEVRRLLAAGAWGNAPYGGGGSDDWNDGPPGAQYVGANKWRAPHAVAQSGRTFDRVALARMLVKAGCNLDVDDGYGATPLYMALREKHDDLASFLIEAESNVNTRTRIYIDGPEGTPLHVAVQHDRPALAKAMIDRGASIEAEDTNGALPLHSAAAYGSVECARLLLAAGAEVNATCGYRSTTTPLLIATRGIPNPEMVRLLLDAGANVRVRQEWQFLTIGADNDNDEDDREIDEEERVARERARAEERKIRIDTPLLNAVRDRWDESKFVPPSPEVVRLLIVCGADVNEPNEDGSTPLHLVAETCWLEKDHTAELEIARLLIDAGTNLDARDKAGKAALDILDGGGSPNEAEKALASMIREAAARKGGDSG